MWRVLVVEGDSLMQDVLASCVAACAQLRLLAVAQVWALAKYRTFISNGLAAPMNSAQAATDSIAVRRKSSQTVLQSPRDRAQVLEIVPSAKEVAIGQQ